MSTIYKTFYGKHIDLSKIVSISDARATWKGHEGLKVRFEIQFQLMDVPVEYSRDITDDERERGKELKGSWQSLKIVDGGSMDYYGHIDTTEPKLLCINNLQKQIDEIIFNWSISKIKLP